MRNRISKTAPDELLKGKLINSLIIDESVSESNIVFGVVVVNIDPLNANRVKVRIPKVDDSYFTDSKNEDAYNNLPWCLPISRNFISTPEINTIVAVEFLNTKTPSIGRIYIDCITDLSDTDLFNIDRLREEFATYMNFENVESAINTKIQRSGNTDYSANENVEYNIGIRGKGENKVLLKKNEIELSQGQGDYESVINIGTNIFIKASSDVGILSNKGGTHYHPVFHKPMYDYISQLNGLLKSIVMIQSTIPSICSGCGLPNTPNPSTQDLIQQIIKLYKSFIQLKIDGNGHSKYVWVN